MSNFISSHARILFSLMGPQMPGLVKYTQQYSTKNTSSSHQIQEACSHPSIIIQQALKTIATIQGAQNACNVVLDDIIKQRSIIDAKIKAQALELNDKTLKLNK